MALVIYAINGRIIVGDVRPGSARFGEPALPWVADGADGDGLAAGAEGELAAENMPGIASDSPGRAF